jgi:hypothetical protein
MDDTQRPLPRAGLPTGRKLLAAAFGVLAVFAMLAGVVVLTPPKSAAVFPFAEDPPVAPYELGQGAAGTAEVAMPPGAAPSQRPGTVMLPGGGTARLVRKEVTPDAILPIPRGLDDAAWWGAALGADHGAALLSGHVNWSGKKGPFDELWSMRAGQEVSVVDVAGGHWLYRVTGVVTVHKDDLPARAPQLFGQDGPPRLVLVTCGGDYLGGTDGYRDNRVISARLLSRP